MYHLAHLNDARAYTVTDTVSHLIKAVVAGKNHRAHLFVALVDERVKRLSHPVAMLFSANVINDDDPPKVFELVNRGLVLSVLTALVPVVFDVSQQGSRVDDFVLDTDLGKVLTDTPHHVRLASTNVTPHVETFAVLSDAINVFFDVSRYVCPLS